MNSDTASGGAVITYTTLVIGSRELTYPGYKTLLRLVKDIQSPIERVFRLQKFIDTPYRPRAHVEIAQQLIKDLQDGSIQLHDIP